MNGLQYYREFGVYTAQHLKYMEEDAAQADLSSKNWC